MRISKKYNPAFQNQNKELEKSVTISLYIPNVYNRIKLIKNYLNLLYDKLLNQFKAQKIKKTFTLPIFKG